MDNMNFDYYGDESNQFSFYRIPRQPITDILCSTRPTLRIGGENIPTQQVKDRFMLLNYEHLEYVFDSLAKNSTQIRNIQAYLLTAPYMACVPL